MLPIMSHERSLQKVESLLKEEKNFAAIRLLEQHLKEYPEHLAGWWLAALHMESRDRQLQCLKRVLELDPSNTEARTRLKKLCSGETPDVLFTEEDESRPANRSKPSSKPVPVSKPVIEEEDEFSFVDDDELELRAKLPENRKRSLKSPGNLPERGVKSMAPNRLAKTSNKSSQSSHSDSEDEFSLFPWSAILIAAQSLLLLAAIGMMVLLWTTNKTPTVVQDTGPTKADFDLLNNDLSLRGRAITELDDKLTETDRRVGLLTNEIPHLNEEIQKQVKELEQAAQERDKALDELRAANEKLKSTEDLLAEKDALIAAAAAPKAEADKVDGAAVADANPVAKAAEAGEAAADAAAAAGAAAAAAEEAAEAERPVGFTKEERVNLPKPVVDIQPAGGGRYLVLKLEGFAGLMIVDTKTRKLKGSIRLPSEDFLYAAGGDKALVYFKENNLLQVWGLKDHKSLKTKPNPIGAVVTTLTMGHSNDELALIRSSVGTGALDNAGSFLVKLRSLEPVTPPKPKGENQPASGFGVTGHNTSFRDFVHHRSNGELTLVSEWCTSHSPTGVGLLRIKGTTAEPRYEHDSAGSLSVGDDGRIYASSGVIYNSQLTKIGQVGSGMNIPGLSSNFFLSIGTVAGPQVFQTGGKSPIVTLDKLEGFATGNDQWTQSHFTSDRRVVFAPRLGYLAFLTATNDQLVLRPFNLKEELSRSGVDYLIVTSSPNDVIRSGSVWNYQIEVSQKNKSPLKFSLQSAPDGMSISNAGVMKWAVPKSLKGPENIIVLIENENHDSTFHSFELRTE